MPSKKNKSSNINLEFRGNVNTNGGDVGGIIRKGNVYQASQININEIDKLFQPVYKKIAQSQKGDSKAQGKLKKYVGEIQNEVARNEKADGSFVKRRLKNIASMAPDIYEVAISLLTNLPAGLGVVARKIAEKARKVSEKDVKKTNE